MVHKKIFSHISSFCRCHTKYFMFSQRQTEKSGKTGMKYKPLSKLLEGCSEGLQGLPEITLLIAFF